MSHLSDASPLLPAPGRTLIPLDGRWAAVVLEPFRGHPYRAIGFFDGDEPEELVDEPEEVLRILPWLQARSPAKARAVAPASEHASRTGSSTAPFVVVTGRRGQSLIDNSRRNLPVRLRRRSRAM